MLAILTLSPFLIAPLALWAGKRRQLAAVLAMWPAILAIYFGVTLVSLEASGPVRSSLAWANSLGLTLSFHGDGLGLVFAVVIAAVGALSCCSAAGTSTETTGRAVPCNACSPSWAPCLASCFPTTFCLVRVLGADGIYVVPAHRLRPGKAQTHVARPSRLSS